MNEEKSILSKRINQMRKELNLTQEELAKKLGLNNKSSIANYESGYSIPSDEIKLNMCTIFNCSMDYLMGKSNLKVPLSLYDNFVLTNIKKYVISRYLKSLNNINLSKEEKNDFLVCIDNYISNGNTDNNSIHQFLKSIKDKNESSKLLVLYTSIVSTYVGMCVESNKYIPLAQNKNNVIYNLYEDNYNTSSNFNLDSEAIDALSNIMKQANKLFIDGPIYAKNDISSLKNTIYACPVYGQISAGIPNWAEECIEGRLPIDPNLMGIVDPEECYFLRVNGESMNKVIRNGAYALIRKTDWVENGEIAVVLVNGFDATLKKFTKNGDVIVLEPMSDDPTIQTQIYTKDTPIKIIGKYIGKFEMKK